MAIDVNEFRLKLYPSDFDKVRLFYQHDLGLPVINEWNRGANDKGVMFKVGATTLELISPEVEGHKPISGVGVSWEVSDVKALWLTMKDGDNIVFSLRDNDWGDTSFSVADPEGFKIVFFTKHS